MGVSQHIGKKFQHRVVWNTNKKVKESFGQVGASKATYMSWFGTAKAFANVQNGRTYAQVASQTPKCTCGTFTNRDNVKGTRIVTVPQRNANAALVTSSKVSIEPKSSRPVGRSSPVALKHKPCAKNVIQPSKASFDIPVKNSFQILQNLTDNTDESHENAPTGLDEVVTASAGTTLQRSYKEIPNGFHKQVNDHKLEVSASPSNSHNNIGYMLEKDNTHYNWPLWEMEELGSSQLQRVARRTICPFPTLMHCHMSGRKKFHCISGIIETLPRIIKLV